ncbi:MAG: hypothetical protein ACFFAN_09015 [Promethearchaeota archaeon]
MKILIIYDFFNQNYTNISNILNKFLNYYRKIKIKRLVKRLIKQNNENKIEIKIFTSNTKKFHFDKNIKIETLSDLRINIDRIEYLKIVKKIKEKTKTNLGKLLKNLRELKTFYINGIFIGNLIEYNLLNFFFQIFEAFELLKKNLQIETYNKVILFDCNPSFLIFFRSLHHKFKNIEKYSDFILKKKNINLIKWTSFKYLFFIIKSSLKAHFFKKIKKGNILCNQKKKNIIFIVKTKNQINSIKPIYNYLEKDKDFNLICYNGAQLKEIIPPKNIKNLLRFIFQIRKIWLKNQKRISINLEYDLLKLDHILKEFYYSKDFFRNIIYFFNKLYYFKQLITYNPPSLVCITNRWKAEGRLFAKYCKVNKIPTIFIPHSAIVIFDEMNTKSDIDYFAAPGECDKDSFIKMGEPINNIVITGRPRYEIFYKREVSKLSDVKDMFNNRVYKFEPNKFTILLTTNYIGDKLNELLISIVLNSLKELNLIDNLIIKLHPNETGSVHKKILQKLKVEPIIVRDYNILELIKSCNLLLTRKSTTILEAMIIGIPIILLDFINIEFFQSSKYRFLEEKLFIKVKNPKMLTKKIKDLIINKDLIKKYSRDLKALSKGYSFYDEKEGSTKKIVNLIFEIIQNNKNIDINRS